MSYITDMMAEKLGQRMTPYQEELAKYFDESHWKTFGAEYAHDFWTTHINRTEEYDKIFVHELSGKSVLEVGGFPGLLLGAYLLRGAHPTAVDHPGHCSQYYLDFLKRHGVRNTIHDINLGPPPEIQDEHFDVAVMSDVMLHNNGMPLKFLEWLKTHVDEFYLINYKGDGNVVEANHMDLRAGHNIAAPEKIDEWMGYPDTSVWHQSIGRVIHHYVFTK